jgi:deazaflavin-dependent oxidoreductase (nitroreductase family)
MGVELTPHGSYGPTLPTIPAPLQKIVFDLVSLSLRLRGAKILKLTSTGAKTGKERTLPLRWFPDGDQAWLIVGSAGGAAKHPAWYFNLARNPDKAWIEVDGHKIQVQPESLKDAAYDTAWKRIVAEAPGFAAYRESTDRRLPIIRLTPKK